LSLPSHIGRYEVLGLLGTGGMAEVFLTRIVGPSGFRRPVVIKKILPHLARQQSFVDMFLDEARIVARIHHANVVHVEELHQEGEELFIAMEYLEGESLDGIARRLAMHKRLLDYGVLAHILAEACAGLHAAHELTDESGQSQNLVHRDVSPANIFVTYDGTVKLLDFGIATAADRLASTQAGQVKGKYPYMSPEQLRGHPLDRRSDIFSLGTVLYELSTVRRLFKRATELETANAITKHEVTAPSKLIPGYPAALEQICMRALEKNRELRFQSAQQMRRALISFAREQAQAPEEMLSGVMKKLFADRIEEKRSMLRKIAQGSTVTTVPIAEVDENVELQLAGPTRDEASAHFLTSERTGARRFPRRAWLLGATAAGAIVIGSTALLTTGDSRSADALGVARTSSTSAANTFVPALPQRVTITISSEPAGARVTIAGTDRGSTPLTVALDSSTAPVKIELLREEFRPVVETIVPDRDQRVRVLLVREERAVERVKTKRAAPSKKSYRRFE
jgi:eukaryotic-like serine/threonine-protein kinase